MKPAAFRRWRKSLGFSQKDAAEALGLKRRVLQYYEKGERDGKPVKVPKTVRLACYAIAQGVDDFRGREQARPKKRTADPAAARTGGVHAARGRTPS